MKPMGLALATLLFTTAVRADVQALPPSRGPRTVAEAVPHILGRLTPTQRFIIQGTSQDNLVLFMGEWGEDIELLLGRNNGNTTLTEVSCAPPSCAARRARAAC